MNVAVDDRLTIDVAAEKLVRRLLDRGIRRIAEFVIDDCDAWLGEDSGSILCQFTLNDGPLVQMVDMFDPGATPADVMGDLVARTDRILKRIERRSHLRLVVDHPAH